MTEEKRIILISEFIETKLRKEKELEYYLKELRELEQKILYLRQEVGLTNTIINMIKSEKVLDIAEHFASSNDNILTSAINKTDDE